TANATSATYQWINCNGYVPIIGQISQSYTVASSGSYAVIVTKNGCSATSSCHAVIITGINETITNSGFSLYPNPSKGRFVIETNQTENSSIEIYNLIGAICYHATITAAKTEIDISKQPSGIYFVKYNHGNTIYTKRIIIE
ncbi:MAG: T9SS type A sorting domain-containing protein, partial [Bacteroidetes bacterium]|nr:T9SS type A sorting domain-containing protein [Bacteroidota bacterium]